MITVEQLKDLEVGDTFTYGMLLAGLDIPIDWVCSNIESPIVKTCNLYSKGVFLGEAELFADDSTVMFIY